MNIIISNSSGKPIYEQITSQIKNLIISGHLKAGDALPSMRTLAKDLRISVITTKRAYNDLEQEVYRDDNRKRQLRGGKKHGGDTGRELKDRGRVFDEGRGHCQEKRHFL